MTNLVLDASASVDLLVDTTAGRSLQHRIPHGANWWVPEHSFVEVAGALRRVDLHSAAPSARIAAAFASLSTAPLRRVQVRPLLAEAWAKRPSMTVADAIYVVLAEHLQATLVTSDLDLVNAPTLSVPTIHPSSTP